MENSMDWIGSPCALGAKQDATPHAVSSMPLKGTGEEKASLQDARLGEAICMVNPNEVGFNLRGCRPCPTLLNGAA